MMKTVVVFKSISGFTKKYAEWIAEELETDLLRLEKINIDVLLKYDIIIYGGSLHAVGISWSVCQESLAVLAGESPD